MCERLRRREDEGKVVRGERKLVRATTPGKRGGKGREIRVLLEKEETEEEGEKKNEKGGRKEKREGKREGRKLMGKEEEHKRME